jgi:mannose-1-phosphate guanylyltransferase / mannose-6-phosphate isomerase
VSKEIEYRPWGGFQILEEKEGFKVKRIWVNPGEVLSLQSHAFRSEHWVIVKGTGEVTVGNDKHLRRERESAFIPLATVHQMANPGQEPLEFIEIQQGTYLGEDDIVRYADKYGRSAAGCS